MFSGSMYFQLISEANKAKHLAFAQKYTSKRLRLLPDLKTSCGRTNAQFSWRCIGVFAVENVGSHLNTSQGMPPTVHIYNVLARTMLAHLVV